MKQFKTYILLILILITLKLTAQTYTVTDAKFATCLRNRYPSTINSSNIIVNTEAEKQSTIICNGYQIIDIEGIQAFKNLKTLDLKSNSILELPNLDNLTKLIYLDVSSNQLTALPSFSKLVLLNEIYAQRNQIRQVPLLSHNDSLITLYLHTNNIDILPDLSNLKQLKMLNVAHNDLKVLPNLDSLSSLVFLYAWSNQLTDVPSLEKLTSLVEVNLAYNQLTKTPSIHENNPVKIFYLNDNKINEISSFETNGNIETIRLYNNDLNFKELNKFRNIPNYLSILKVNEQRTIKIGKSISIKEMDSLKLNIDKDKNIEGVTYNWFKDGKLILTTSKDELIIPKVNFTDSGFYSCTLQSSFFPSLILKTDSFWVNVVECLNLNEVFVTKTDKKCTEGAQINIKSNQEIASFELSSNYSSNSIKNKIGEFKGLTESQYFIKLVTPTGCEKNIPTSIFIDSEICDEVVISPNGDGLNDSYSFEEKGQVDIYDRRGNLIQTLQTPAIWNGTSKNGKVSSGFYMADINKGEKQIGITIMY